MLLIDPFEISFKESIIKSFGGQDNLLSIAQIDRQKSPENSTLKKTLNIQVSVALFKDLAADTYSLMAYRHFKGKIINYKERLESSSDHTSFLDLVKKTKKHYEAVKKSFLTCADSIKLIIIAGEAANLTKNEAKFINSFINNINHTLNSIHDDTFLMTNFLITPSDDELQERFKFLNTWLTNMSVIDANLEKKRHSLHYKKEINEAKAANTEERHNSYVEKLNDLIRETRTKIAKSLAKLRKAQELYGAKDGFNPLTQKNKVIEEEITPKYTGPKVSSPKGEIVSAPLKETPATFKLAKHSLSESQLKTLESYLPYSHFPSTQNKGFSQVDLFMESCALRLEANNPQELKYFLPASTKNGSEIVFGAFIYEINANQTIAKKEFVKEGDLGDLVTCAEFSEFKSNNLEYPVTENRLAQPGPRGTIAINFQGNDTLLYVNRV